MTKEVVDQIKQLRNEDPERWNLKELSKKFDIELSKLVYFLRSDLPKLNKPEDKASVPMYVLDREKRRQMWMKNIY